MRLRSIHWSKLLIVFALACAMASFGFAHRFASERGDPALDAYLAAGGSLEDLCIYTEGSSHKDPQTCAACRLVSAIALPDVVLTFGKTLSRRAAVVLPRRTIDLQPTRRDLSRAARGPPTG